MRHLGLPPLKNEGVALGYDDPSMFFETFPINQEMLSKGVAAVQQHYKKVSRKRAEAIAIECWIAMSLENALREGRC